MFDDLLHFEKPGYLVLLALLPLLVVFSLRSLSGLGPWRRTLALSARSLVVLAMILALAGAHRVQVTRDLSVVFVVDRSNSVPPRQQEEAFAFIQRAAGALDKQRDRFGVVVFNGVSAVEQLPDNALGVDALSVPPLLDQTNLAAALRMASALFTNDAMRRIVVLTDGNENVGQALEEADQLAAAGVPIDVVPLRYEHRDEVVFDRLTVPPTASVEETVNVQMVLRSQRPTSGKILLYQGEQLLDLNGAREGAGYPVALDAGPNRFQVPIPLRAQNIHRFRAVFEPDEASRDTITGNNQGQGFTVVSGPGRVLILTTESDAPSAELLANALRQQRFTVDVEPAGAKALDQVDLLPYSLVILSNVARNYLTAEQEKTLSVYVRDLGGGLVMVGGDESYGAGGWMGSPLEDVMPVSFDIKSKRQIPKGALVLVMHACEIPQGNYWGERVAVEAVKTLSSRDLVGILQYAWQGSEDQYWVTKLREVGDKTAVIKTIKDMNMGDMPDLDAVMRPGVDALADPRTNAAARHMIIVSDFDPAPPTAELIKKMQDHKITCSTVAIGFGGHPIDVNKARWIAQSTGGKYYATNDPQKLPQIFIKEAQVVRRSLINETPFRPTVSDAFSPVIAGMTGDAFPPLGGYVLTTPKPTAQMALVRPTEDGLDPVLAHWQVGLGKTVAFTSGMWHRWGSEWSGWPAFSKMWAQVVRWAARQSEGAGLDVATSVEGGRGRIRVSARDKSAAAINFMSIRGELVDPSQNVRRLQLTQIGPGEYEGEFDARSAGSYVFSLGYSGGGQAGLLQTGVSVAYSPEFRELRANEAFLGALAQRGNSRTLAPGDAARVFDRAGLARAETRRPIWEALVHVMLALFLLDVAIRRVAINPIELGRRLRRRIAEMGGARAPAEASAATLATLRGTREGVREALGARKPSEAGPAPDRAARYEAPTTDARASEDLSQALGGASELNAPVVARPTRKPVGQSEADYTSRLLQAKRKARDEMREDEKN